MTVLVILLTPVLLLAIVALFGFVGCSFHPGAISPSPQVGIAGPGASSVSVSLSNLSGGELLVATVEWGGSAQPPAFTGAAFQQRSDINGGNAFDWNGMRIQVFTAINSQKNTSLITATFSSPSNVECSLCVWPYPGSTTLYGAVDSGPNLTGTNIAAPPINVMNKGDAIYAVAYAADAPTTSLTGKFPGNNLLTPGNGFTSALVGESDPLLEGLYATASGPVTPAATNTAGTSKSKGFIFAVAVK
jgi:hypothetical protein